MKYVLRLDLKHFFPNWDRMTKEEQQSWYRRFYNGSQSRRSKDGRNRLLQGR